MKRYGTILLLVFGMCLLLTSGCETDRQNKALLGAAIGAAVGQAAGHDTQSTLIGAGVGGAAGYAIGKDEPTSGTTQQVQQPAAGNTISVWITNSNGSQTQVKLTRNADGSYTGPKGERYATMPTEEQLKQAYGF